MTAAAPQRLTEPRATLRDRGRALYADSLLRNSALLLISGVTLAGGGFLFWQLVARLVEPAELGRASALISVSTLVANLALLGLNNALIRYLGRWPDPARTVNTGVLLVAGAALLGGLGFAAGAPVFAPRLAEALSGPAAVAFGLLTAAGAVGMLYDNVFIAQRRSGHIVTRNLLVVVLRLALPAVLAGAGAFGVFTAYWLAFAVALVPYLLVLRRTFRLRAAPSVPRLRAMWGYSLGTYAATIILMLPSLAMPAVVAERLGLAPAAYYYVASLLAGVLLFVPQAAGRGLFAEALHDGGSVARHLRRVLWVTAAVQVPLLVLLIVLGRPLLHLFGGVYTAAYPVLVLLAVVYALGSVGFVGSTLLLISGRTRLLVLLSGGAGAIALGGGWLLAPRGLVWVGAALVVAEALLAAGYLRIIRHALRETS